MDIALVRQQLLRTIDRAKRAAAERRARTDEASRDYLTFLETTAVPIVRQVANALKAEGYTFNVFTPSQSVRLMSERNSADFIEIVLDTSGEQPLVMGRSRLERGHRVVESERPIASGAVQTLTEQDVLDFVLAELTPFVER